MAMDVASPPEYASTMRCMPTPCGCSSFRRVVLEPLDQRAGTARAARDHENRVVARNRADRFRQPRAIERFGQCLRLPAAGPDDDELLDAFHAAQELGRRTLERGQRRLRIRGFRSGPLIRAVAGALHEPELLDVARNRRLRGLEAVLMQPPAKPLLALDRFAVDQL